jgi:hypothetical protein
MSELIRREDAIKATWQEPSYTDPYNILTEVRDRIQALPTASPWHRVEEELPPKATWVLTVATDGNVKLFNIATVDAGGQWWTCSPQNILRELYGVRYWMPIEPPKEDA